MRGLKTAAFWMLAAVSAALVRAQAPLQTDDAGTTPHGRTHYELFGQHARLAAVARPATSQDTLVAAFAYGVGSRVEVGFDVPWIDIHSPEGDVAGAGDFDLTAKISLRDDGGGKRTAWALGLAVELPTGDAEKGLGSGVADEDLTLIAQRRLGAFVLQGNLGLQFAGNTLTGAVGTKTRGRVLSADGAISRALSERWWVSAEVTGYQGRSRDAADREVRAQLAATCTISPRFALAAGLQHGWFASPPWVVQLGMVIDP